MIVGHNLSAMPSGHTNTFHVNFKDVKTFLNVANYKNLNLNKFLFFFPRHFFHSIRLLSVPYFLMLFPIYMLAIPKKRKSEIKLEYSPSATSN